MAWILPDLPNIAGNFMGRLDQVDRILEKENRHPTRQTQVLEEETRHQPPEKSVRSAAGRVHKVSRQP